VSVHTPHRHVLDGPVGALQDKPIGDLGRRQALWATDELNRDTVHIRTSSSEIVEDDAETGL
jgi:hypothetical protein